MGVELEFLDPIPKGLLRDAQELRRPGPVPPREAQIFRLHRGAPAEEDRALQHASELGGVAGPRVDGLDLDPARGLPPNHLNRGRSG